MKETNWLESREASTSWKLAITPVEVFFKLQTHLEPTAAEVLRESQFF